MLKNYYCPVCKELKTRFQLKKNTDYRLYWLECKWCHSKHIHTKDEIIAAMASTIIEEPNDGYEPK